MTKGYMQIGEDDWIEPTHGRFVSQCCDCHLVHIYKFAVVDRKTRKPIRGSQVQFKVTRDDRKTAASRRKLKLEDK